MHTSYNQVRNTSYPRENCLQEVKKRNDHVMELDNTIKEKGKIPEVTTASTSRPNRVMQMLDKEREMEEELIAIAIDPSQQEAKNGASTSTQYKERVLSVPTTLDPKKNTAVALAPSEWAFKKGTRLARKKKKPSGLSCAAGKTRERAVWAT